ncbi:hypothetical protein BLD25_00430 [Candidatus Gracilibacteria bacterium GN02-872]|nr:hypothetical protein BLD25_00430 [Candidatus Gracilibacteria bacterium GN02-872]RKW20905.1 MAG: type II secretion system protein [Candidatus Gracilibacteria bacterium]
MRKSLKNKKGYSIIIVTVIIGFLILLTSGVFRLIMGELKDNQVLGSYVKTYAGAESAQELALLDIKENGFGSDKSLKDFDLTTMKNIEKRTTKDVIISFGNDGKTNGEGIEFEIKGDEYNTIPLFYLNSEEFTETTKKEIGNGLYEEEIVNCTPTKEKKCDYKEEKIKDYEIKITNGSPNNISWNVIGKQNGISGDGSKFKEGALKSLSEKGDKNNIYGENREFSFEANKSVSSFLEESKTNYLQLYNAGDETIKYSLTSAEKFTKPEIKIISSGESGSYKTNIETRINLADLTSMSRFSIFSPDNTSK